MNNGVDQRMHNSKETVAWALGLAACLCNIVIILVPIGLLLGVTSLIMGLLDSARTQGGSLPALALSGVSFLIAAMWVGTILSIFAIDPTLL